MTAYNNLVAIEIAQDNCNWTSVVVVILRIDIAIIVMSVIQR